MVQVLVRRADRLPSSWSWSYAGFWTAESVAAWAWLFAICAFAHERLTRQPRWLVHARDAVYPFYVLHQPILVLIAWKLVPLRLPIPVEFSVLLAVAFLVIVAACEAARRGQPTRVLLGMRQ